MIREVFQMHVAQRPMCSPGAEIACHRSGSGTADPGWDMSSCLQVLRLAESGAADAAWARGSPARGRLRKPHCPPGAGSRPASGAARPRAVPDGACQLCWPGRAHRSPGKAAPSRAAPRRGASAAPLPHHELGGAPIPEQTFSSCSFHL